jgi:filamentous hemagglutinin family protein
VNSARRRRRAILNQPPTSPVEDIIMKTHLSRRSVLIQKLLASVASVTLVGSVAPSAHAQTAFGSMVAMQAGRVTLPDGTVSQWRGAGLPQTGVAADGRPLMTIQQTQSKALLDWQKFKLQTGEILEFKQASRDWIAVNRVHGADAAEINGEIRALGRVFVLNDNGVLVGKDARINVRQLVTGSGVDDVNIDGLTTSIVQSKGKAILDWRGDSVSQAAGEILKFSQKQRDWVILNRFLPNGGRVTRLDGTIAADGGLFLVAPSLFTPRIEIGNLVAGSGVEFETAIVREFTLEQAGGLAIGGVINAAQITLSSLNVADSQFKGDILSVTDSFGARSGPQFSNLRSPKDSYYDPALNPPLQRDASNPELYNVTIGANAVISAAPLGKVFAFGPNVINAGTIRATEGQIAIAAGERVAITTNVSDSFFVLPVFSGPGIVAIEASSFLPVDGASGPYGRGSARDLFVRDRVARANFSVVNTGKIISERGEIDIQAYNIEQKNIVEATSSASFRGKINLLGFYVNIELGFNNPPVNGAVRFGPGSSTRIVPDFALTDDKLPISATGGALNNQSIGAITVGAKQIHLQRDAELFAPSGNIEIYADATDQYLGGRGANSDNNEDGSRLLLDPGSRIDVSGWDKLVLPMSSNEVTGRLFIAQLRDAPVQRDGPLYRQTVTVDRRFGTAVADTSSFDNLNRVTLPRLLTNGGTVRIDASNDFIMAPGSEIDVSGGAITYEAGFVNSTLLRTLDNRIIDIRNANPDEVYAGIANQFTPFDAASAKWQTTQTYYIPLLSSKAGRFEEGYQQGGDAGSINSVALDVLLQGRFNGGVTVGKFQRDIASLRPRLGRLVYGDSGFPQVGWVNTSRLVVEANEKRLPESFTLDTSLAEVYGNTFGTEFEDVGAKANRADVAANGAFFGNSFVTSDDFFNRSVFGSYSLLVSGTGYFLRDAGGGLLLDAGGKRQYALPAALDFRPGTSLDLGTASLSIDALGGRIVQGGRIRTTGGSVSLSGSFIDFSPGAAIDTSATWTNDREYGGRTADLTITPVLNAGSIALSGLRAFSSTSQLNAIGGAWLRANGELVRGRGGNIAISQSTDELFTILSKPIGGQPATSFARVKDIIAGRPGDTTAALSSVNGTPRIRALGPSANGTLILNAASFVLGNGVVAEAGGMAISPSLFAAGEFSAYELVAPGGIAVAAGTLVDLRQISLTPNGNALTGDALAAAPSGTKISTLFRAAPQRNGASLALRSATGDVTIEPGASLRTGTGGGFLLTTSPAQTDASGGIAVPAGTIDVGGDIIAPAGAITLSGGDIRVRGGVSLRAPGAVRVTSTTVAPGGRTLRDGVVLPGGSVSLSGGVVTLEPGAIIDVSGTSAIFDIAQANSRGDIVRTSQTITSAGGTISVGASNLTFDGVDLRAGSGGPNSPGGTFAINLGSSYSIPNPFAAQNAAEALQFYTGVFFDDDFTVGLPLIDGTRIDSSLLVNGLYGIDLAQVDWQQLFPSEPEATLPRFTAPLILTDAQSLTDLLNNYERNDVLGIPPALVIGENLPADLQTAFVPAAPLNPGLVRSLQLLSGYVARPLRTSRQSPLFKPSSIAAGGFGTVAISSAPGVRFVGDVSIGSVDAAGGTSLDQVTISTGLLIGDPGAAVTINAARINFGFSGEGTDFLLYRQNLGLIGIADESANTRFTARAGATLSVTGGEFFGFDAVRLESQGDIVASRLFSPGALTLKADQILSSLVSPIPVGVLSEIRSNRSIEILAADAGTPVNPSPYTAGTVLNLRAPRIIQGGTLRAPLGTITLTGIDDGSDGAGRVTLLPGSLTSVSAEGRVIPYDFIDRTGVSRYLLPEKRVALTGDVLDIADGATINISGGGDILTYTFTPGVGGSNDWLTGYRNSSFQFVTEPGSIFAVVPGLDVTGGDSIYLSGGSGLAAGNYTLLPARFALLPGAFRVTARNSIGDFSDMILGTRRDLADGSSIQAGYRFAGDLNLRDQRTNGFLVMPGSTLRQRSEYEESLANSFFISDAFRREALRTNQPLRAVPLLPADGGTFVIAARQITLDGDLKSAGSTGARGGLADIRADRIAVISAQTTTAFDADVLLLDSNRLSSFGAESLLLGGTRRQTDLGLELTVSASEVTIDNPGATLSGPEIILAATDRVEITGRGTIGVTGNVTGSSGPLLLNPLFRAIPGSFDPVTGQPRNFFEAYDRGAVVRISADGLVPVRRDVAAVARLGALAVDPAALDALNLRRADAVSNGQIPAAPPITSGGGLLAFADGARIIGARSVALDGTGAVLVDPGASIGTRELSAAATSISIGDAPAGLGGLVLGNGSLGALAGATELTLRSSGSIDFYGTATLAATSALNLDAPAFKAFGNPGDRVEVRGDKVTIQNSGDTTPAAGTAGSSTFLVSGREVTIGGGAKTFDQFGSLTFAASERLIGEGSGTLVHTGDISLVAPSITGRSASSTEIVTQGRVNIAAAAPAAPLSAFRTSGANFAVTGTTIEQQGRIDLAGGTVSLRATDGDVNLANTAAITVAGANTLLGETLTTSPAGLVRLISDTGNVVAASGSLIDLSGGPLGGDAGALEIDVPLGTARLAGTLRANAAGSFRQGSFGLTTRAVDNFAGLSATLLTAGFNNAQRFRITQGDVTLSGESRVRRFDLVADTGAIVVGGTVDASGDDGGRIALTAAQGVTLAGTGALLARGNGRADGSGGRGGDVTLATAGLGNGVLALTTGGRIDVGGTVSGGTIRLRTPQRGGDVAIAPIAANLIGARSTTAEGYRVYTDVATIDAGVIATVTDDAATFMARAAAIEARLGGGVRLIPGIEIQNRGDISLTTDWNLSTLRYNGVAGALTLRAGGDLRFDANLSDGFDVATRRTTDVDTGRARPGLLTGGPSWSYVLTAGADVDSVSANATLSAAMLAPGKGSVIVGGIADTPDFYSRGQAEFLSGAPTPDTALFFLVDGEPYRNVNGDLVQLPTDPDTGLYYDPASIVWEPESRNVFDASAAVLLAPDLPDGQYTRTDRFSMVELPLTSSFDRSDGFLVRTGTGTIDVTAALDVRFAEKASVLYTGGEQSAAAPNFTPPSRFLSQIARDPDTGEIGFMPEYDEFIAYYPTNGGAVRVTAGRDLIGAGTYQAPSAWLDRFGLVDAQGYFAPLDYQPFPASPSFDYMRTGRDFEQTTSVIRFDRFKAGGVAALGGGDVTIATGRDVRDVAVNLPTTLRATGNRFAGDPAGLVTTGGGQLAIDAGRDIAGGHYYAAQGGASVRAARSLAAGRPLVTQGRFDSQSQTTDVFPLFFTSDTQLSIVAGGDLTIQGIYDPLLLAPSESLVGGIVNVFSLPQPDASLLSYSATSSVDLVSTGGDVIIRNGREASSSVFFLGNLAGAAPVRIGGGVATVSDLWPATVRSTAANGSIAIEGSFAMAPSATGNLELLAGEGIRFTANIFMSQARRELLPNAYRPLPNFRVTGFEGVSGFRNAGYRAFDIDLLPDLHVGDPTSVVLYADTGDIVGADLNLPKPARLTAGGNIYFANLQVQHNGLDDLTLLRAGDSIYFSTESKVLANGPGRLELEAGRDIYLPSNPRGIQSRRILLGIPSFNPDVPSPDQQAWRPDEPAADITISAGINQTPAYAAFESKYLDPAAAATQPDYVVGSLPGGRTASLYLIDRDYPRTGGVAEKREGLVNYVRRLAKLAPLADREAQVAFLDEAWALWQALPLLSKQPFLRDVLFLEERTAGREANDPASPRAGNANRGYAAITTLFPGSQRKADEPLQAGESRWTGDFETFASVVRSEGGGDINVIVPGGAAKIADARAAANETGQPSDFDVRGNALRAGLLTIDGGAIRISAYDDVAVNQSRILTAKGGDIQIWSSFGDIAAGRGAQTSISPPFFDYANNGDGLTSREPAGLPTGAGIGTLATVPGAQSADVDLIAPAGIVDAGDAGIRVSGNFNVFAVQILGLDNITVAGVATGLPPAPPIPPTSLDTGELSAKANDVGRTINDAVNRVRQNASIVSPSLIEVRITGQSRGCEPSDKDCPPNENPRTPRAAAPNPAGPIGQLAAPVRLAASVYRFDEPAQPMARAIRTISQRSSTNIVYDPGMVSLGVAPALKGVMTVDDALRQILRTSDTHALRTDERTVVLKPASISATPH